MIERGAIAFRHGSRRSAERVPGLGFHVALAASGLVS
jgi:hypothetical protein